MKNILEMNIENKEAYNKDLKKIKFLTEQSSIEKELSIDKIKEFFNSMQNLNNLDLKLDTNFGVMMFLRGNFY